MAEGAVIAFHVEGHLMCLKYTCRVERVHLYHCTKYHKRLTL